MRPATPTAFLAAALCAVASAQSVERAAPAPFEVLPATMVPEHLRGSVAALAPLDAAFDAVRGDEFVRFTDMPIGPSRTATLVLRRVNPFTPDARVVAASVDAKGRVTEREVALPDAQYWSGTVEGEPGARAMLARTPSGVVGYVDAPWGTAVISSPRPGSSGPVTSFVLAEVPEGTFRWDPWTCDAQPAPDAPVEPEGAVASTEPCRQLRVAVETDWELRAAFGATNDPTASLAGYVGTLFAGIAQIYAADLNVRPSVGFLRIWETSADPWNASGAGNQLGEFRNHWEANMSSVQRNVAAMLSGRGLGGGVAWLSAACASSYAYSVSGNLSGWFPYPLADYNGGNWDLMVTAHELGHNVGAPHTHDYCPTPGDSCAPNGYFGQCQTAQECTSQGTIMSYCHTCAGGVGNIGLRFHPLNVQSIVNFVGTYCNFTAGSSGAVAVSESLVVTQGTSPVLDVLANEAIANCEAVSLEGVPAASEAGFPLTVIPPAAGAVPGVRIDLAPGFAGTDRFTYRVREASGGLSDPATATVSVTPIRHPENAKGDAPGLAVKYFALTAPESMPDFELLSPYSQQVVANIDFASTGGNFAGSGRADEVGAEWTGWLRVDQAGTYRIAIDSDDGSRVWIGDRLLVNNDGLHGMLERSGTIVLGPGKHAIRVEFFEYGGGAGCILRMEGPGIPFGVVGADRLTHGGRAYPWDLNGDRYVDGMDLGELLGSWGIGNSRADFNRDGSVDGIDLGALLGNWGT
jgi:hypothetical protein